MGEARDSAAGTGARALRIYWIAVALLLATAATFAVSLLHWGAVIEAADTAASFPACAEVKTGVAGRHLRRSRKGVPYTVVTPRNYQAMHAYPLLVVYAPAGLGARLSERHAGLTQAATRAGFVLAFAGSARPLGLEAVARLAEVPDEVAADWCVDETRVYATGHSDGGTVAMALAARPEHRGRFDALVVSGAGWQARDFVPLACVPPTPVMILHGEEDGHFPGFGRESAARWSRCNACMREMEADAQGCRAYTGCAAATVYCQTPGRGHWRWAGASQRVIGFLAQLRQPSTDAGVD